MSYSEGLKKALREAQHYPENDQSFYLGWFAEENEVPFYDLMLIQLLWPTNTIVGYLYGQLEAKKEDELDEIAEKTADEKEMRELIEATAKEVEELAKLMNPESGFDLMAFFRPMFEQRMTGILSDKARGVYPVKPESQE